MVDLAVLIVTWNVRELVLQALQTLIHDLQDSQLNAEVLVVDSASSDGTVTAVQTAFPEVKVISSPTNLGFGAANNMGLRALGFGQSATSTLPKAVYLLNPDTLTLPGATRQLYDHLMSTRPCGMVGAQLAYGDGSFQHGAFMFPGLRQLWVEFFPVPGRLVDSRFNGRYAPEHYEHLKPFEVDFVLGATMMLKAEVIHQTGMFDEQFFMYCEEIDWAWRIHQAGWKVYCVPAARVTHLGGQSTGQVKPQSIVNLWRSRLLLFSRYYPRLKYLVARHLIIAGMNRKLQQLQHRVDITPADRDQLSLAYRTVRDMAQQS